MKSTALHAGLAGARWEEKSLVEQLPTSAARSAEPSRAKSAANEDRLARALDRCLELFDRVPSRLSAVMRRAGYDVVETHDIVHPYWFAIFRMPRG